MTSLRKYVPVASGSIMRIKNPTDLHELGSQPAASLSRSHLFLKSGFSKKIDRLALKGFQNNERKIEEQLGKSLPIVEKYLSMRIDTHKLGARRRKNFIHLHKLFSKYNSLAPYLKGLEKESAIPFSYPLLPFNSVPRLREELSKNGVYTPVLWGSLKAEELGQLEQTLLQVVHIPVSRKLMKRQEIFLREILEAKE